MFAIPGLVGLLLFVYLRPQEIFEPLAGVSLAMALSLVVLGLVLDWRSRVSGPRSSAVLWFCGALFTWAMVTAVIKGPLDDLTAKLAFSYAAVLMCPLISQTVQTFRALRVITGVILGIGLFLAVLGIQQGLSPKVCILREGASDVASGNVATDGRVCAIAADCERDSPEEDIDYRCDHAGWMGTSSIAGRVRYRGILQDPNELAWILSLVVPLAFTFFEDKRSLFRFLVAAVTTVAVMICVVMTKSRSGQLSLLTVVGAYFIRRFGWRGVALGAILAMPLLLFGGRSGEEAESSSVERLECWQTGLEMFRGYPILGVGYHNFGEHHYLTAHNSFILTLAEMGPLGLLLWTLAMYAAIKISAQALRDFSGQPAAAVAARWAMAFLAGMLGTVVSSFFLSIAYHALLWLYLGLVAAFYAAVRRHKPTWKVSFGWRDLITVGTFDFALIAAITVYIKLRGV